jgi:hypothetical protein
VRRASRNSCLSGGASGAGSAYDRASLHLDGEAGVGYQLIERVPARPRGDPQWGAQKFLVREDIGLAGSDRIEAGRAPQALCAVSEVWGLPPATLMSKIR